MAHIATACEPSDTSRFTIKNTSRMMAPLTNESLMIAGITSRAKDLWTVIRKTFLNHSRRELEILKTNSAKPYQITIKQGLQCKFHFKTKHYVTSVVGHLKIPRNRTEGIIREIDDTYIDKEVENNILCPKKEAMFNPNERKSQETSQYTFTCTDSSGSIKSWDLSRTITFKPTRLAEINQNIKQIEFIPKYSLYATCSDDKAIKV